MTLIVYKDGFLAADTRATPVVDPDKYVCGHCGEKHAPVRDNGNKLTLLPKNTKAKFWDQRVLAIGQAGEVRKSEALVDLLRNGVDIEEAYRHFIKLYTEEGSLGFASLIIICETNNFIIRTDNRKRQLTVIEHTKEEFLAIGSGAEGAKWINYIATKIPPANLINVIMAKNNGVGGDIHVIDFNQENTVRNTHQKIDPAESLSALADVFARGVETIHRKNELTQEPVSKSRTEKVVPI